MPCHRVRGPTRPRVRVAPTSPKAHGTIERTLVAADGGRSYPILVVLYGLQGAITVHGTTYDGLMPPLAYLTDEQISDVLNYVMVAWGDAEELAEAFEPYAPEEVAEERGEELLPTEVHVIRATLDLE